MIRPLTRAVLVFAAALVAGLRVPTEHATLLLIGALACALGLAALARRLLPLVLFGIAGLLLGADAAARTRTHCVASLPDGVRVEVSGHLDAQPDAEGAARVRTVRIRRGGVDASCRAVIRVHAGPTDWRGAAAGDDVGLNGRWLAFPAEGRWPRRAERSGVLLADSVRVRRPAAVLRRPAATLRGSAQRRIRELFDRHPGLVEALVLAERGGVDPALRDRFARAGLSHLLAISGLHVGIVAAVLVLLARLVRLPGRGAALAAVAGTIAYVLLLGAPHAAARAALQLGFVTAARLLQRPSDRFTPLAAAALVLLVVDPLAILDPGFQLSFAGRVRSTWAYRFTSRSYGLAYG